MSWLDFLPFRKKADAGGYTVVDLMSDVGWSITPSKSGQSVTLSTALQVSAVYACVRVISEGVAQVPFKVFRDEGRDKLPAKNHPLYDILHRKPNSYMTSFSLRETMMIHALLAGGAVAFVNRTGRDRRVSEIIPLDPSAVRCTKASTMGDAPRWDLKATDGTWKEFPAEAIWHIPGPSWDGVIGMDALKIAREAIGLTIATESSQAVLHDKGVRTSGIYSVEGALGKDQYTALRAWITEQYAGAANAGVPMILDRNAKFMQTQMTGVDAQHIETRRHQVEEVCRYFRVRPSMIGHSGQSMTFAAAEQEFLAHVVHTLTPWYERVEQSADCQLLTDEERAQGYYTKFVTAGLLRGALKDTADFINKMVTMGVMTRNEGREKLELNPLDGLDEPLTPLNMRAGEEPKEEPDA